MGRLIPTPLQVEGRGVVAVTRGFTIEASNGLDATLETAAGLFGKFAGLPPGPGLRIVPVVGRDADMPERAREFLAADSLAAEQGYALEIAVDDGGACARVHAFTSLGAAYGLMTLAQWVQGETTRAGWILDKPDFRRRGVGWLLAGECFLWSYDWGDGLEGFRRRALAGLDLAFRYKLNLIDLDGFGWNPERFPGYGAVMRELNAAARRRGIRLMSGGYGEGYGASAQGRHDGPVFRNRRGYPDGEIYACCQNPGRPGLSATFGSCRANDELTRLKQENLREFVAAVEPGALYIHNLDSHVIDGFWEGRCEDCHRRWPNDDLFAADGLAGAVAYQYDRLAEAVFSVRNPETGYDASRDCLCVMVSPGYASRLMPDEQWDRHVRYWAALSGCMERVENVEFGMREQFEREDGRGGRIAQMAQALRRNGRGHGVAVVAFGGGDGYMNDRLFCAQPCLARYWAGAETVVSFTGSAYQEPMQLLQAEYFWRSRGSAFYEDPPQAGRASMKRFGAMTRGRARPEEIYGPDGFLGEACRRLYGDAVGPVMARLYAAETPSGDPPVPYVDNGQIFNHSVRRHPDRWLAGQWSADLDVEQLAKCARRLAEVADLNRRCAEDLAEAPGDEPADPDTSEKIAWYRLGLEQCGDLAELLARYFTVYGDAQAAVREDGTVPDADREAFDARLEELDGEFTAFEARLADTPLGRAKPLDPDGGAAGRWPWFLDLVRNEIARFRQSLLSGDRGGPAGKRWW